MDGRRKAAFSILAVAASTLALGLAGITPASAAVVCGQTISASTTLTQDLNCPGNGLTIIAPNVSLNLNGFTISGTKNASSPTAGVTVSSGNTGARISNGTIRGFNRAIGINPSADNALVTSTTLDGNDLGIGAFEFPPGSFPQNARIISNTITKTGTNAIQLAGTGHLVQNNTVSDSNGTGLFLIGSDMIVSGNTVTNSGAPGISITTSPSSPPLLRNQLLGNRISGSGRLFTSSSISVRNADGTVVTANTVEGQPIAPALFIENSANTMARGNQLSLGRGILVRGASANTTLLQNRVQDNSSGITVESQPTGTLIQGNIANDNQFDGINVQSASATVTGNTAYRNGTLGIRAVAGVVDGGGNRAFLNGNPAQCSSNISC